MKAPQRSSDPLVYIGGCFFVGPRIAIGFQLLALLGLAAFLVFSQVALVVLRRMSG
jgi:hypothetical protein